RIKALKPTDAPPTFHLPGGPGGSYLPMLQRNPASFLRYRACGDVVVIDQRGFSQRGEVLKFHANTPDDPLDQPANLERECADFVKLSQAAVADCTKKGIDLRGYTVKECVEDLNDLRQALGYKQVTLVGVSFGSQWSFATMKLHPEIVARAVLSGVEPLDMGFDMPTGVYGAIQRIWKEAEKDKALQPYLPAGGLEAAAQAVAKRLDAAPVKVTVKEKDGEAVVTLGKTDFQQAMQVPVQESPAFMLSLYYEHYDGWAKSVLKSRRSHGMDLRIIGPCIDTSLGVTPGRLKRLKADPMVAMLGEWNWASYIAAADTWPSADVGDEFRTPVETPIPVVFAEGDWDTKTPFENTVELAKSFPKSRVIIDEHGGHGVLDPICVRCPKEWNQILDFIQTGTFPELPERVSLPTPKFTVPDFPPPTAAKDPAEPANVIK
ncbi:MAG TPA: alpha/beta hydrolase, partial [Planctomycetota bacterium]|nr:alpha/beta hydrolase [Planctomycetota bacterium]